MSARRKPAPARSKRRRNENLFYFGALAGGIVLVAAVAIGAVLLGGGGDGDDDSGDDPVPTTSNVAAAAAEAIPNLGDLGYRLIEQGKDPLVSAEQDMARARYQAEGEQRKQVLLRIYFAQDEDEAFTLYGQVAQAYAAMPIQALINQDPTLGTANLPGGPANVTADGPTLGEQHRSYETAQPDSNGNAVWTDVYLQGRTVVAIQVLDNQEADVMGVRTEIAERILAESP